MAKESHKFEKGSMVSWGYGSGMFSGTARGEIIETNINKFGYNDVMKVETLGGEITHIRPKDCLQS